MPSHILPRGASAVPSRAACPPSVELQTETYERCLEKYSLTTCFDINGTTLECGSAESFDSFQMPDW